MVPLTGACTVTVPPSGRLRRASVWPAVTVSPASASTSATFSPCRSGRTAVSSRAHDGARQFHDRRKAGFGGLEHGDRRALGVVGVVGRARGRGGEGEQGDRREGGEAGGGERGHWEIRGDTGAEDIRTGPPVANWLPRFRAGGALSFFGFRPGFDIATCAAPNSILPSGNIFGTK